MKHVDSTINKNDQKKICITLRFIDSFKFLASNLEKLALYLDKNKLRQHKFLNLSTENFDLLTRKGIFSYEYVEWVEKLKEAELPSRESFYNLLTDGIASESDYAHAVNIWQRYSIQTFDEYNDLYLKTDVLLLADIFSKSLYHELWIRSCILLPGFYVVNAMLKHTRVNFEFLIDVDIFYSMNVIYVAIWDNVQTGMRRPTTSNHTIHRNHRRTWCTMTS